MTDHEIAVLMVWAFGIIWLGMIARIIVKAIYEKPKDNNDLQRQNSLPVPRPFGSRAFRQNNF